MKNPSNQFPQTSRNLGKKFLYLAEDEESLKGVGNKTMDGDVNVSALMSVRHKKSVPAKEQSMTITVRDKSTASQKKAYEITNLKKGCTTCKSIRETTPVEEGLRKHFKKSIN